MKQFAFILLSFFVLVADVQAQLVVRKPVAVQWTENMVSPALFLFRQSFQVADNKTGDLYGLNNQDEFGAEVSIGIKVKDGFVLTDKAMRPWAYNRKFDEYKEKYKPVPYLSQYSEIETGVKYDSINIMHPIREEQKVEESYLVHSDFFKGKGLSIDNSEGSKDGWIVFVCANKEADLNKISEVSIVCYNKPVDVIRGKKIDVEAPSNMKIIGGVYVYPHKLDIGVMTFKLCGLLLEDEGKWRLAFPFVGKEIQPQTKKQKAINNKNIAKGDTLTPVDDDVYVKKANKKRNKKSKK